MPSETVVRALSHDKGTGVHKSIAADTRTYVADLPLHTEIHAVAGALVESGGETFYRVTNVDAIPPFLMSLTSAADHWMFVSSTGALTAGRISPDRALFPY